MFSMLQVQAAKLDATCRAHQRFPASCLCVQSAELAAARGAAERAHSELQAVRAAAHRARVNAQAATDAMCARTQELRRQCADATAKLEGARAVVAAQREWAQAAVNSLAELRAESKKRGDSAAAAREEASTLSTRLGASAKVRRACAPAGQEGEPVLPLPGKMLVLCYLTWCLIAAVYIVTMI